MKPSSRLPASPVAEGESQMEEIQIRWNEMAQVFFVDFGPRVRFTSTRKAAIQLSDALRAATRKERD